MKTKRADPPEGNSWADNSGRHAGDAFLRRHGFKIHARPRGKVAIWVRDGQFYAYDAAITIARSELTSVQR